MHNGGYNKGLAEDSIEMRMAGTKKFDVLLEGGGGGGGGNTPDGSMISNSMQDMSDEDKKRSFANFTDSFGRQNSQSGNMSDAVGASPSTGDNGNVKFTNIGHADTPRRRGCHREGEIDFALLGGTILYPVRVLRVRSNEYVSREDKVLF